MYVIRSQSVERVELGRSQRNYFLAGLLIVLGLTGLAISLTKSLHAGGISILGAASLVLLAAGSLMLVYRRSRASRLVFDNTGRSLRFVQRSGLEVPVPYDQIRNFEACHIRQGEKDAWMLVANFRDGTNLPLLKGSEKRMQERQHDFNDWVFLEAKSAPEPVQLPPLPAWLEWNELDGVLHCSWKSRQPWSQILVSTGFILAFAVICFLSAHPDPDFFAQPTGSGEAIEFWIFRGFSGFLALLSLVLLGHGIRTRERRYWLEWSEKALSWGYRSFITRQRRVLGKLEPEGGVHFYWLFGDPHLVALDSVGEADLQRKRRLNPSYSMQAVLHRAAKVHRLEMELPGFSAGEIILLQEQLELWQTQQPFYRPPVPDKAPAAYHPDSMSLKQLARLRLEQNYLKPAYQRPVSPSPEAG